MEISKFVKAILISSSNDNYTKLTGGHIDASLRIIAP